MYDTPRRFGWPTCKKSEATFFKIFFRHEKKNFVQKKKLSNILFMKYSDLNFYWNRSSRTWFARAIWSHAKRSKMSPGMSCSNHRCLSPPSWGGFFFQFFFCKILGHIFRSSSQNRGWHFFCPPPSWGGIMSPRIWVSPPIMEGAKSQMGGGRLP